MKRLLILAALLFAGCNDPAPQQQQPALPIIGSESHLNQFVADQVAAYQAEGNEWFRDDRNENMRPVIIWRLFFFSPDKSEIITVTIFDDISDQNFPSVQSVERIDAPGPRVNG